MEEGYLLFIIREIIKEIEKGFQILGLFLRFGCLAAVIAYLLAFDDYGVIILLLEREHIIVAEAELHAEFVGDRNAAALAENLENLVHV